MCMCVKYGKVPSTTLVVTSVIPTVKDNEASEEELTMADARTSSAAEHLRQENGLLNNPQVGREINPCAWRQSTRQATEASHAHYP